MNSPYHEGELLIQRRVGESSIAERNGVMIKDAIIGGALPFIRQQPLAVLGSLDKEGRLWASLVFGKPGFLDPAKDARSLRISLSAVERQPEDPFWRNIAGNSQIAMLVIELGSRRRLRINGRVAAISADEVLIEIDEAYPNCPKYIQRRHVRSLSAGDSFAAGDVRNGNALDPEHTALIRRADTFFVATAHVSRGADVSHRGGNPGFVKVLDETTLSIPDYRGNSMFNTLGNLAVNPNAGLVFPDFENRRILQLTGTAEILWNQADAAGESGGTGRFWDFHIKYWLETQLPSQIASEFLDYSPYNPKTEL